MKFKRNIAIKSLEQEHPAAILYTVEITIIEGKNEAVIYADFSQQENIMPMLDICNNFTWKELYSIANSQTFILFPFQDIGLFTK